MVAPSLILTDTVLVLRLVGPDCKFVRGEAAKARVRPVGVVVLLPYLDQPTSARQVAEHVRIEALVAEATVQALDEAVLHRLGYLPAIAGSPAMSARCPRIKSGVGCCR